MRNEENFKNALNCLYSIYRRLNEQFAKENREEDRKELEELRKQYKQEISNVTDYFGLPASFTHFKHTLERDILDENDIAKLAEQVAEDIKNEILNVVNDLYLEGKVDIREVMYEE